MAELHAKVDELQLHNSISSRDIKYTEKSRK